MIMMALLVGLHVTEDGQMREILKATLVRFFCLLAALPIAACTTVARHPAPPMMDGLMAPVGFPSTVRFLGIDPRYQAAHSEEIQNRIRTAMGTGPLNILAISGGGSGGAFGAGALVGLDRRGERPPFAVVTGVSTGALLAPFAFLGPAWDQQMTEAYASVRSEHLLQARRFGFLFRSSIYKGKPLIDLVDHFVTDALIQATAQESAKGRLLLVATTYLDNGETVIWDMGAIATQGGEAARTLFRDVLVASASIPGLFPPVLIHVESSGASYDEMHVDGGTTVPFFFAPEIAEIMPITFNEIRGANLYVLINGQLITPQKTTADKTVSILKQSFAAQMNHASRTTLELSAAFAQLHGMNFRFSRIPSEYPFQGPLNFKAASMQALFNYAAGCAAEGQLWTTVEQALARLEKKMPPGTCPT
jgi:predicted patatin/cPLA2 family phospholipase